MDQFTFIVVVRDVELVGEEGVVALAAGRLHQRCSPLGGLSDGGAGGVGGVDASRRHSFTACIPDIKSATLIIQSAVDTNHFQDFSGFFRISQDFLLGG